MRNLFEVTDVVSKHQGYTVPHAKAGRECGGEEPDDEQLRHERSVAVLENVRHINEPLIIIGDRDVGAVKEFSAQRECSQNKNTGNCVSHRIVHAHNLHPFRCVPFLFS